MVDALDSNYLALTAIVTIGYQLLFFIISYVFRVDKFTDFAGTTNFALIALLTFFLKGTWHFRQIVLTALVVLWSTRLATFLVQRILRWGEDNRFDDKRDKLPRLALFWTFQALWVWAVHLPVTVVNGSSRNPGITAQDWIGWALWGVGIIIETVADETKLFFKNDPQNKDRWVNVGLWKWSRHPNYFGEMLLWWAIFLASTPVLRGGQWAVICGPILLTLLLLFVSGIPLLEASSNKRHGKKVEFIEYRNATSPLIPLPPVVYGSLSPWFKSIFLFEFPLYRKNLDAGYQSHYSSNAVQGVKVS